MQMTLQEIVAEIAKTLESAGGDFVAEIYNQVCENDIRYIGDSLFEPEEPNIDHAYELRVDGKKFLDGDQHMMALVLANLLGHRFVNTEDPKTRHRNWLASMEKSHEIALPYGAKAEIVSADGSVLTQGTIGEDLI